MEKLTQKEVKAVFLVRLAMALRKGKVRPTIVINGRYR
jgi:hypothetical protein